MIDIYRIDHIGHVVPELSPQVDLFEGLFGFRTLQTWESASEGCKGALMEIPGSSIRWEVLAPTGESSPTEALLGPKRRAVLHHVAVEVPDLERAEQEISALGVVPGKEAGGGLDSTLLPSEGTAGITWRLFGRDSRGTCGQDGATRVGAPGAKPSDSSLGIIGIDHVCQAYRDRDELASHYTRLFGMNEVYRTPDGAHEDLADLVMTIPGTAARWEIIMPVGQDSFIQGFFERSGAAVHHVTFEVRDWEHAVATAERHNAPTFDANQGETNGARWRDAFIHPKHTGGVLVQLFWEERPGVWSRSDKVPPKH